MLGYVIVGVIIINGIFILARIPGAQETVAALRNLLSRQTKVMRDANIRH